MKEATRVILENERGEVLLLLRAQNPRKGCYDLPGGGMDQPFPETPLQCIRREIREELQIEVDLEETPIEVVENDGYRVHYFIGKVYNSPNIRLHPVEFMPDPHGRLFFSEAQVSTLPMAFPDVAAMVKRYFNEGKTSRYYDLKYSEVFYKASHNSYQKPTQPITRHLDWDMSDFHLGGCRSLEFDLMQADDQWAWSVQHSGAYSSESKKQLSTYLKSMAAWSSHNPNHDVVMLSIDLKNAPLDNKDFPKAFDDYLRQHFVEDQLFKPGQLMGNADNLVEGVMKNGWASLGELAGKFIVVFSGHEERKAGYAAQVPHQRLCFSDHHMGDGMSKPLPERTNGDCIFFNFYLDENKQAWEDTIRWFAQETGFISRGYLVNTPLLWDRARRCGLNIMVTDHVFSEPWAHASDRPMGKLPEDVR